MNARSGENPRPMARTMSAALKNDSPSPMSVTSPVGESTSIVALVFEAIFLLVAPFGPISTPTLSSGIFISSSK